MVLLVAVGAIAWLVAGPSKGSGVTAGTGPSPIRPCRSDGMASSPPRIAGQDTRRLRIAHAGDKPEFQRSFLPRAASTGTTRIRPAPPVRELVNEFGGWRKTEMHHSAAVATMASGQVTRNAARRVLSGRQTPPCWSERQPTRWRTFAGPLTFV